MCDHCSAHWLDLDIETGEPIPKKGAPPPPIPEKGCEHCKRFFGWVVHREYRKGLAIVQIGGPAWAVGYWNEDKTMFTVLGWFSEMGSAVQAEGHLAA
jgi:hypothetical protein